MAVVSTLGLWRRLGILPSLQQMQGVESGVLIVALGPIREKVNLARVVRRANRVQSFFTFRCEPLPLELGAPGPSGQYEFEQLVTTLKSFCTTTVTECVVAVTDAATEEELFSVVDQSNRLILIFLHGNDIANILQRAHTTYEGYVLAEMGAQLLTREYRLRVNLNADPSDCFLPWHKETRSCVFDYCDIEDHTGKKLMAPSLCQDCREVLARSSLEEGTIEPCFAIFNAGPGLGTILWELAANPLISFVFGGVIGGVVFSLIGWAGPLLVVLLVLLLLVLIVRQRKAASLRL